MFYRIEYIFFDNKTQQFGSENKILQKYKQLNSGLKLVIKQFKVNKGEIQQIRISITYMLFFTKFHIFFK